jgi:hypothetical protein
MSIFTNRRTTIAVLAAAATATSLGCSIAPAGAVTRPPVVTPGPVAPTDPVIGRMSASLSVTRNYTIYNVDATGVVSMTPADAQKLVDGGYRVRWRLWGSDPVSDDFLFGPDPASISVTPQGLAYRGWRGAAHDLLNEDDSLFDDHDELIAGVDLVAPDGTVVRSAQSNEVGGYF